MFRVSPSEIFQELARSGWQPRSPATDDELPQLLAFTARGTCLNPVIIEGDTVFVDPRTEPQDRDIIAFRLNDEAMAQQVNARSGTWLKLLIDAFGQRWLAENEAMARWEQLVGEVLGVVRAVRRDGVRVNEDLRVAGGAQIGIGAATETITSRVASYATASVFGADTSWLTITTAAQNFDHTIQVTASLDVWKAAGASQRAITLLANPLAGGPPFYDSSERDIVATASPGERMALQSDFPALAGTQYIVRVGLSAPGGGSGAVNVRDATLRVEHIKR